LRLPADWRFALATSMRMVSWVHSRAANRWPAASVTVTASLSDHDVFMIHIANLSEGGHAVQMNKPNFA